MFTRRMIMANNTNNYQEYTKLVYVNDVYKEYDNKDCIMGQVVDFDNSVNCVIVMDNNYMDNNYIESENKNYILGNDFNSGTIDQNQKNKDAFWDKVKKYNVMKIKYTEDVPKGKKYINKLEDIEAVPVKNKEILYKLIYVVPFYYGGDYNKVIESMENLTNRIWKSIDENDVSPRERAIFKHIADEFSYKKTNEEEKSLGSQWKLDKPSDDKKELLFKFTDKTDEREIKWEADITLCNHVLRLCENGIGFLSYELKINILRTSERDLDCLECIQKINSLASEYVRFFKTRFWLKSEDGLLDVARNKKYEPFSFGNYINRILREVFQGEFNTVGYFMTGVPKEDIILKGIIDALKDNKNNNNVNVVNQPKKQLKINSKIKQEETNNGSVNNEDSDTKEFWITETEKDSIIKIIEKNFDSGKVELLKTDIEKGNLELTENNSVLLPYRAILFNCISVDADEDKNFSDKLEKLSFCLANGIGDVPYYKKKGYYGLKKIGINEICCVTKEGYSNIFLKQPECNDPVWSYNEYKSNILFNEFILFMKALYQSYSLQNFSKELKKVVPQLNPDKTSETAVKDFENLYHRLAVFQATQMATSVSYYDKLTELFVYIKERLRINEDVQSVYAGIDTVEELVEIQHRRNDEERQRKIDKALAFIAALTLLPVLQEGTDYIFKIDPIWKVIDNFTGNDSVRHILSAILGCAVVGIVAWLIIALGVLKTESKSKPEGKYKA